MTGGQMTQEDFDQLVRTQPELLWNLAVDARKVAGPWEHVNSCRIVRRTPRQWLPGCGVDWSDVAAVYKSIPLEPLTLEEHYRNDYWNDELPESYDEEEFAEACRVRAEEIQRWKPWTVSRNGRHYVDSPEEGMALADKLLVEQGYHLVTKKDA